MFPMKILKRDVYKRQGQGFISLVAPTGLILMSLMMVNIGFNKWFKFCWKLLVIEFGICLAFLAIGLVVY